MVIARPQGQAAAMRTEDIGLRYGVPDVEFGCAKGGTLNPSKFVGHQLLVLFLPTAEEAAVRELQSYSELARDFAENDAWLMGVAHESAPSPALVDRCQQGWRAFERLLNPHEPHKREEGGAYLFGRGGNLQRAWFGPSHASDVVEELTRPSAF
jgi:hypothetical protein